MNTKFLKLPQYMIIHLKRFEEQNQSLKKIKKSMEYPLQMDMDELVIY